MTGNQIRDRNRLIAFSIEMEREKNKQLYTIHEKKTRQHMETSCSHVIKNKMIIIIIIHYSMHIEYSIAPY